MTIKFDDAETYFLNFTTELPNEAGGIPIGLYLLWAADAGLVPEALKVEIAARRTRGQSSADILFDLCDGKLTSDELNEEGGAFTDEYYGDGYLADYRRCFRLGDADVDALCSVPDTAASVTRLKPQLNERLIAWRAKPRVQVAKRKTSVELFDQLQRDLLPLLRADGFEDRKPRGQEFEVHRRVGPIEQVLLYMVYDASSGPVVAFGYYLGAEAVRKVWLRLAEDKHHAAPPPAFSAEVRHHAEVQGDELSLAALHQGYGPYYAQIAEGPDRPGQIAVAHYLEHVRPRMGALNSIAALAEQVLFKGQQLRLSNKLGFMSGTEVLARAVLLSVYSNRFHGGEGPDLIKQLHEQIRRNNRREKDEYPMVEDLDRLITALKEPEARQQARAFLDQAR